jgi:hypothetical protein
MRTILMASAAAALVSSLGFAVPASAQTGSYQQSCRNVQNSNGTLSAECSDGRGGYRSSSLSSSQCRGDIGNNGGMLSCNGANATGGQSVSNNNRGASNDRRDNNNNNNNVAIAGAAGLVAGVALANGGHLYAPGYAYPTYGQTGYGDPRRDPRYAQGGYAYGHANGQWMPIAQRAQWLDQRINRGSQEGTLDRGDVHSLRQELTGLERLETRYQRSGMQGWEMADLDKRFDALASRIQYERTDGDNGRNDRRDYQNRYNR